MKKSLNKDIVRTIWKEKKRFIAIMLITTLGVTMMTCLGASCRDLRLTADEFYRNQDLFDIHIVSTLGLTHEDVSVLGNLEEIQEAEGTYSEVVRTKLEEQNKTAEVKMFREEGICVPYIVEGTLPQKSDEIAVTENYINESGKKIGDTVEISEFEDSEDEDTVESNEEGEEGAGEDATAESHEEAANFLHTSYAITGIVVDVADVNNPEGAVSFRATPNADYTFFVVPEAVNSEIYTEIYLTVNGAGEFMTYSEEYEEKVASVVSMIESEIMEERERARYDEVKEEALGEIAEKEAEMNQKLADAQKELDDAAKEIADAKEQIADAQQKIQDAKDEVGDLKMAQWYVQDRTSLSGYSNVSNDSGTIESLATVFMVVFFIVAILISLTTITRMVEEERGLIGTYKALGFYNKEIRRKYMIYAFAASFAGGILGDFAGFVILPEIVFCFFKVMYAFPGFNLYFDFASGTYSVLLFMAGIIGAAFVACLVTLKQHPASLMRPKAPKMGARVLLERIAPLWKRLTFLNKVTARNLFRYKKRLFMTILGIMGCTALVVFGFAIKDSVQELMPLQYDHVNHYDILAAASAEDNDKLMEYMDENAEVADYLNMLVTTVKLENADKDSEKVQLLVFSDNQEVKEYLSLMNADKEEITIEDEGVYLTENAAKILGLTKGDSFTIQTQELLQEEAAITDLVKNYLGNYLYMTKDTYEELFGTYEANGVLANLSEECEDHIAFSKTLAQEDWILSSYCTQDMKENFSMAFTLINIVVYVVLVMAAGLAFVVLFTLASINISERNRELATIKVLGFYDREVHSYVNKETIILTTIGIMLGLPVGRFISNSLTSILSVPSVYFEVTIYPQSYLYAAAVSFLFAFMVQFMTNRSLDVINPVEALKSVE